LTYGKSMTRIKEDSVKAASGDWTPKPPLGRVARLAALPTVPAKVGKVAGPSYSSRLPPPQAPGSRRGLGILLRLFVTVTSSLR
jgi:hypothetical protein